MRSSTYDNIVYQKEKYHVLSVFKNDSTIILWLPLSAIFLDLAIRLCGMLRSVVPMSRLNIFHLLIYRLPVHFPFL